MSVKQLIAAVKVTEAFRGMTTHESIDFTLDLLATQIATCLKEGTDLDEFTGQVAESLKTRIKNAILLAQELKA